MKAAFPLLAALLLCACNKSEPETAAPADSATPSAQGASAPAGQPATRPGTTADPNAESAAILDSLTQVLRKYSAEKQRVPTTFDELVKAGYLPQVPEAPAGRKFVINAKTVEVTLEKK